MGESAARRTLGCCMTTSSLEELKGQIAAGTYTVDSRALAGEIVTKFALARRVAHMIIDGPGEARPRAAGRLRDRSAAPRARSSRERLS